MCRATLLLQADMCRHLADAANEVWVAVSLRELAEQFLAQANHKSANASATLIRSAQTWRKREGR
jgi:hypothetical protein